MTIWPLVALAIAFSLCEAHAQTPSRGLISSGEKPFIPKGTKSLGISVAHNNYLLGGNPDNGYNAFFSLFDNVNADMATWSLAANGSYFLKDDFAIGVRLGYDRTELNVNSANLSLSDLGLSLGDNYHIDHEYTGAVTARYVMPVKECTWFAFFTDLRAYGGFSQGKTYTLEDGRKTGSYNQGISAGLAVVPGIMAFFTDNVAFEAGLKLLSLDWKNVNQTTNQVEHSESNRFNINYRLNLLSVEAGLVIYLF